MGLPFKTKILVFTAVMGGFLFGYDTGVMSGCLVALEDAEPTWEVRSLSYVVKCIYFYQILLISN
jgi:hypothetical protein